MNETICMDGVVAVMLAAGGAELGKKAALESYNEIKEALMQ
jgi:hypothetical protein